MKPAEPVPGPYERLKQKKKKAKKRKYDEDHPIHEEYTQMEPEKE